MLGYKVAKNDDVRVVVTLFISTCAQTNVNRSSVMVKETAKHRANKALVLEIQDSEGKYYDSAVSFNFPEKSLTYKVGETVTEPCFDTDLEVVCGEGIHFFLTRSTAEQYGLSSVQNGVCKSYYDNGIKHELGTFKDGKKHGLFQRWFENGQIDGEATYVDGLRHGLYQRWKEDGTIHEEVNYTNGVKV